MCYCGGIRLVRFGWSVLAIALVFVSCGVTQIDAADALRILFLGDQGHHRPPDRFRQLQPALRDRQIELTYSENVNDLNPNKLNEYDGLMVFANIDEIGPEQEKALIDYVEGGRGFIPLHCASYCFRNSSKYVALVGAQFQRHSTGTFRVSPSIKDHPITQGYGGFESWDETYVHTKHNEKDRTVLEYRAEGEQREPWTWVRNQGKGRVFYTAWGHDERTWSNPGFINLVERGVRWACHKDVSVVPLFVDKPEMTALTKDVKPFEYVDADVPFYPPGKQWGTLEKGKRQMQLPVAANESMKHISTPVGFEVKLFLTEPDLQGKPLAMSWDERGRLWVCETFDYPNELQPVGKGRDRIRICEDTNGDGRADKFTVFADQLSIPTSIAFYRGGAIVQDGEQTLYLKDTNGDDKADIRKALVTGWVLGDTHGGVSNFQYGLDNWFYAMQGYNNSTPVLTDGTKVTSFRMGFFRFKVEGDGEKTAVTEIEFLRSTNNNTWGLGISEEGLIFGSTANGNPSEFMPVANRYYESVRGWSSTVLGGIADSNKFEPITEKVRQVDNHGGFTAGAGHALYTARNYPREYWNRAAFVTEPTGHLCATFIIRPDGAGFRSKNSWNLFASNDEWSSPIMAEVGPDGNVWLIDWYNFIVQHNPTPAGFKTGKGNAYESDLRDKKHGRIYRLVYSPTEKEKGLGGAGFKVPDLSSADTLVGLLKSDNFFWRRTAQRLLLERGKGDVVPALQKLAGDNSVDAIGLNTAAIHALWTLKGLAVAQVAEAHKSVESASLSALKHPSAGVRRNAVQTLPRGESQLKALVDAKLHQDTDPQTRLAALLAIAEMPSSPLGGATMVDVFADQTTVSDRWLLDASTSAAAAHDIHFLRTLVASSNASDGKKSRVTNAEALERVAIVAESYARRAPIDSVQDLVSALASGSSQTIEPIVRGLAKGWPKDKPVTLTKAGEESLVRLITVLPPGGRGSLINLANRWGSRALESHVAEIANGFLAVVKDDTKKESERTSAAKQLVDFRRSDAETVKQLIGLVSPKVSAELSSGLIEAVGVSEVADGGHILLKQMPQFAPSAKSAAIRVLLGRGEWTKALVDAIEKGDVPLSELSLDQKQALSAHPDKSIASRVKPLMAKSGGLPNPDRQKVIDELSSIFAMAGDATAGKEVFKKTCSKCHTHTGEGTRIGPDLTGMAVHPKHELVIHILDPNRSVEGNFRIYSVTTDDGRVFNGLLASESKSAIELIDSEAKRHTILREEIDELVASKKSLMPEGFEKQHTPKELNDLLEFLTRRGRYLPIPIDKVATIVTTKGMFFNEDGDVERLIFPDWTPKTFDGVPFVLVDPQGNRSANAVMLNGALGNVPPRMPKQVTLTCNSAAKAIHFLSGISGWGFPALPAGTTSMIVRLKYADGKTEDHPLKNGEHFADYIRRVDVPGSKFAFPLRGQQIRFLSIIPERPDPIAEIELVKGSDRSAPIVMAVTVETR